MAAKKGKGKNGKKGGKGGRTRKGAAPSVMGFLKRVGGMPQAGETPAKGLLGDISDEDLREAGRLSGQELAKPKVADPAVAAPEQVDGAQEPGAPPASEGKMVTVEASLSEPQGPFDHLEDMAAEGDALADRLNRARSVGVQRRQQNGEQRGQERHPAAMRVAFRNAGRVEVELTTDISTNGAFVATPTPLEVGDLLMLTFDVPQRRFPLQVAARVKWVTPFGTLAHSRAGMGVEFVALDQRKIDALNRLVSEIDKGGGG